MNKTLLAICPSRNRPETLIEMLKSYERTVGPNTGLVIYVADDDPRLSDYKAIKLPEKVGLEIGPKKFISEVFNIYSFENPDFDYFMPFNDDHYFITPEWDKKLIEIVETKGNGWGIAGADDLLTDWNKCRHPSACVISSNIIKALGYMIWPKIQHIGIDTFFVKIGDALDMLWLTREVLIEHRHWINGRRPMDENYKWVYSTQQESYGRAMIREYMFSQYQKDIEKLKRAMGK